MANTPTTGENCSTSHAIAGETMPETSRKLEYTADISVRSDGLTDIKKGRPAQVSSKTRNKVPANKQPTVTQGQYERKAPAR